MDPSAGEQAMSRAHRNTAPPILILSALAFSHVQAQALPPAATILDRFVEATGGRAAYEAHRSEILTGTIEFPAQGLKGKLTRYLMRNREYSAVDLQGIGLMESGISGGVTWDKSVLIGPRIKQGAEKEQAIREGYLNAPIFWRELYPKVETIGVQSLGGKDCYDVVLTPTGGAPEHQFFSKKTGLLLRTTTRAASQMGDVDVEVDVSDYRKFAGVLMPTRSRQRAASQELTITVDDVRINDAIPDDRFALPPDVAELVPKTADPPSKQ
jgi:hypothetical protein